MDHFTKLFNQYLNNQATRKEEDELWNMIATGKYNEQIKHLIDQVKPEIVKLDRNKSNEIQKYILAQQPESKVIFINSTIRKRKAIKWLGVAAAIALLIVSFFWLYNPPTQDHIQKQQAKLIPGDFYGRQYIDLPDGSTVILNDSSRLTYKASFGEGSREVFLTGEGYFDIKHDTANPFIVHTGKLKTTVLGTAFNVKAYDNQEQVIVTVTRGKVAVGDNEKVYDYILPDEQLAVNTQTYDFKKTTNTDSEQVLTWKSEFLIFDEITMEEVAQIISKRFDKEVRIEHEELKKCLIKATFLDGESLEHIIASICRVTKATYKTENEIIIIEKSQEDSE